MAIENAKFGKGIALAGGFDLGAKAPLDSRLTVATIEERDAHVEGNRAYDGMLVFVEANKITFTEKYDNKGYLNIMEVNEKRAGISNEIRTSEFPPNEPFHSLVAPAHSKVTDNSSNLSLDVFTSFTSV